MTGKARTACASELRGLIAHLERQELAVTRYTVADLCALGVTHSWPKLEQKIARCFDEPLALAAVVALKTDLHQTLYDISRRCVAVSRESRELATAAIFGHPTSRAAQPEGCNPAAELLRLFRAFPVLANLWALAAITWRERSAELFARLGTDRAVLARRIMGRSRTGRLRRLTLGLSDRHRSGGSVAALHFENGSVIYKPRAGDGEWEWQRLVALLNRRSVAAGAREVRVLRRKSYCWMEFVQRAPCRDRAAVHRFYRRAGALAATAEIAGAVDCHRGNLIAAGEHPVLIDADALLHPYATGSGHTPAEAARTQFFSGATATGRDSRTASLHPTQRGPHVPRMSGLYVNAPPFAADIMSGFVDAWKALTAPASRQPLKRLLERLGRRPRRRIYRTTSRYAAIRSASLAPALLRDEATRWKFLQESCATPLIPRAISTQEAEQLRDLDIPYFTHKAPPALQPKPATPPAELLEAIRQALRPTRAKLRKSRATVAP